MREGPNTERNPDRFFLEYIDTVPHLEALLILWHDKEKAWSLSEIAARLFLTHEATSDILAGLERRGLIRAVDSRQTVFAYSRKPEYDPLMEDVDLSYRKDLIRISRLIHARSANMHG